MQCPAVYSSQGLIFADLRRMTDRVNPNWCYLTVQGLELKTLRSLANHLDRYANTRLSSEVRSAIIHKQKAFVRYKITGLTLHLYM